MEMRYRVVTVRNSKGIVKKDPGVHYREPAAEFGNPCYTRIDASAPPEQKQKLQKLSLDSVKESELGGELILANEGQREQCSDWRIGSGGKVRLVRGAALGY